MLTDRMIGYTLILTLIQPGENIMKTTYIRRQEIIAKRRHLRDLRKIVDNKVSQFIEDARQGHLNTDITLHTELKVAFKSMEHMALLVALEAKELFELNKELNNHTILHENIGKSFS